MENASSPASDDEMDLWKVCEIIWSGRLLIIGMTGLLTACGIAYALFAQVWYRADVILAPVNQQSGVSGTLASLGGLANLAGINFPSTGDPQPVAVLKSKDFAKDFILDLNLMPELLGDSRGGPRTPDIRDAVRVFDTRIRSITENTKTRIVTLSIRWKDAETAALWANTLVKRLNDKLRAQAVAEAQRNVEYLRKEAAATNVVSLHQSLSAMLESEMERLMLARGNEQFAFRVIDSAVPPKNRDAPRRAVIIFFSFFAATFLSAVIVLVRDAIRRRSLGQRFAN